jgi:hypothetical protein
MKSRYRDFESAREFVRSLGIKSVKHWHDYCHSGNKPYDIPALPDGPYKNEFKGMGDWLGPGTVNSMDILFHPFKEAREFARSLNLKGVKDWRAYCKSGNKPDDIPLSPDFIYKKDFTGWGDWLGTGYVEPKDRVYRPFTEAREFARKLNLKSGTEWKEYSKSDKKPDDIPSNPQNTYKNEWNGYGDWLDNEKVYRTYKEAREFVQKLGLKNYKEWKEYSKSGKKPDDIPSAPWDVYKEWKKK